MLKKLIQFSIDHAALVLILAGALLAFAGARLPKTPVDVFPELNAPTVVIMTESPGLAADEVEQYVTFPIETSVNGIPGVRRVRTSSAIGLSIAYIEFDWGTDIYRARQLVSERLDTIRADLPPDAHAEMTPITSITGEIMLLAASSPDGSVAPMELRAYAEFDLRNKLLAIPGVAQVSVIGGELPEYQVLVDQERPPAVRPRRGGCDQGGGRVAQHAQRGLPARRRKPRTAHPPERARPLGRRHRRHGHQAPRRRSCHHRRSRRGAPRPGPDTGRRGGRRGAGDRDGRQEGRRAPTRWP